MPDYESKQVAAWGLWLAGILAAVGLVLALLHLPAGRQEGAAGLGMVGVAALVANFAVLKVRVSAGEVRWSLALGIVGRRIPL